LRKLHFSLFASLLPVVAGDTDAAEYPSSG
jgi:hypothetical protein